MQLPGQCGQALENPTGQRGFPVNGVIAQAPILPGVIPDQHDQPAPILQQLERLLDVGEDVDALPIGAHPSRGR